MRVDKIPCLSIRLTKHESIFVWLLAALIIAMSSISCSTSKDLQIPRSNPLPPDSLQTFTTDTVDEPPKPEGGFPHMLSKMNYPKKARDIGAKGKVVVKFVVTPSGKSIGHYILTSPHPLLSKEAIRVVKSSGFKPGIKNGQPVYTWFEVPFHFRMASKSEIKSYPSSY